MRDSTKKGERSSDVFNKALLISYYFPPSSAPMSIQWLRLVRHLPKYRWNITVITTSHSYEFGSMADPWLLNYLPSNGQVYRTRSFELFSEFPAPYNEEEWHRRFGSLKSPTFKERILRRLRMDIHKNLNRLIRQAMPDDKVGWVLPAYRVAKRLLCKQHFDAVITSGMPHSTHLVGLLLKRVFPRLRWLTYFSDPWTFCEYEEIPRWQVGRKTLERYLEKKVLKQSNCNIFNTETTCREYVNLMPETNHKNVTIMCSCDPEMFKDIDEKPRDKFRFQYVGRFFGYRTPRYFLQALRQLFNRRPELRERIEVRFTGNFGWDQKYQCWNRSYIKKYVLDANVFTEPWVSHREAIKRIVNSDALVLIGAPIESDGLYIPSKTFEYAALGRPILAMVAENGATAQLIRSLGCGVVVPVDDVDTISKTLEAIYEARLSEIYHITPEEFENSVYGSRTNAAQFAECLSGHFRHLKEET